MDTKRKIEIGKVYSTKVGDTILPVRIDKSLGHGRYEGLDMHGGKKVTVAAAAIRGDGRTCKDWHLLRQKAEQNVAEVAAKEAKLQRGAKDIGKVLGVPVAIVPPKAGGKAVAAKKGRVVVPAPRPAGTGKRVGGLDAAVTVLAEAGKPMNTADMVKRMLELKLWKTSGKTPAATIYAAIIREIAAKGKDARFRKTDRGHFELSPAGIAARTAAGKEVK